MAKFRLPDAIRELMVSFRSDESNTSFSSSTGSTISYKPRVLIRKLIITSLADVDLCYNYV